MARLTSELEESESARQKEGEAGSAALQKALDGKFEAERETRVQASRPFTSQLSPQPHINLSLTCLTSMMCACR